jgi:hypothetical protein
VVVAVAVDVVVLLWVFRVVDFAIAIVVVVVVVVVVAAVVVVVYFLCF